MPCPAGADDEPECLRQWAEASGDYSTAAGRLEARLAGVAEPGGGALALALAEVALTAGDYAALLAHSDDALRRCFFAGQAQCEHRARRLKAYALSQTDRLDEAIWEAEKAYRIARLGDDPKDRFNSGVSLARLRLSGLVDLGRVELLLNEIEPLAEAVGPGDRLYAESTRAGLLDHLGYLDRAALAYARVRDLARQLDNPVIAASEEFNRIDSLFKSGTLDASRSQRAGAVAALNALIAQAATPASTRLRALSLLARLEPERASYHLRQCLRLATTADDARAMARCAADLAVAVATTPDGGTEAAAQLIELAQRAASRSSNPNADLEVSRARMALLWRTEPPAIALERALALLDAETRRRQRQATPARQLEFLAFLNEDHYELAARISAAVGRGELPAAALERALALLETVRGVRFRPRPTATPVEALLRAWERAISPLRRADPSSPYDARHAAFVAAEALPQSPGSGTNPVAGAMPSVAALRRSLAPGEALLYYQWAPPRAGPKASWVYLLAADTIRAYPLPERGAVELALALLNSGVRGARQRSVERALARLYALLLEPALAERPDAIRLSVIPDAGLYSVPMQALARLAPRRLRIEVYPSLAARSDREPVPPRERSVRIFANPLPPAPAAGAPVLDSLPGAEHESAALAALLGGNARVAKGASATEAAARAALASDTAVVHFATHARLDAGNPQASAVVLAADREHDGWLTLAEIEALRIPSKLVVLSACEAAAGRMLAGEGLIGLSAGFLGAGARAVLANLWPIDDAHAAAFVARVYEHLAAGRRLEQALSETADALAQAGYPAAAWAGWTVIGAGDGTLARPRSRWPWALALGLALLVLAAVNARRRSG